MPQNQARAPLFVEGFPTVPSTRPGDAWSGRCHRNKQTKQNKQPSLMVGSLVKFSFSYYMMYFMYEFSSFFS